MTEQEPTQDDQDTAQDAADTPDAPPAADTGQDAPEAAESFPREYVEKLRKEAAEARTRAKRADDLAHALFVARVAATGRLADPNDLPFNADVLDDMPALEAAIDELIEAHPHYAARRPQGSVGQGVTGGGDGTVDLAGILRARA